jgi:hypothetical protein
MTAALLDLLAALAAADPHEPLARLKVHLPDGPRYVQDAAREMLREVKALADVAVAAEAWGVAWRAAPRSTWSAQDRNEAEASEALCAAVDDLRAARKGPG